MANQSRKRALVASIVALAGVFAWVTWPTADRLRLEDCSPNGLFARLSAAIHGDGFWRAQLAEIVGQRQRLEGWEGKQADTQATLDAAVRQSEEMMNALYRAHPELAPTDAQIAANRLRALADKIESDEANRILSEAMPRQIATLRHCEHHCPAKVALRLAQLILKRASASRPSGEWSEDDYDVLADGAVVGRIMKAHAAPEGSPWFWTLAYGQHEDRSPTHGLRGDPRDGDGRLRQELVAGVRAFGPLLGYSGNGPMWRPRPIRSE
jgi:hypothetical protein